MNHNPKLIRHRALNTLALLFVALLGTSLPQVASAQYLTEDFESAFTGTPAAPAGWTQTRVQLLGTTTTSAPNVDGTKEWFRNTYSGAWAVIAFTSSNDPIGAQSGTGALCIEDSYFGSTTTTLGSRRMESPAMNLSTSTSPYVRFYYSYPSTASNANFRVMASNDNGATWKSIMAISGNGAGTGSAWRRISVLIPAAYRVANAKIGFEMTNTWGTMNLFIDNLSVEEFTPATITSAATGNWNAGTTWVGGVVPDANSHVVIAAGHVVSANSLAMRCQNLTVDGTLQYSTTLTTDLLQILGDATVNATGILNAFSGATGKRMYFGGSLSNAGTVNFSIGAGNLVWLGGAPATISGAGSFSTFISNIWHLNSGGVTYNTPIQVRNTVGLYDGPVNPNGNLTIGNAAVLTQTIERGRGSLTSAPIFGAGVNRSNAYIDGAANFWPCNQLTIIPGEEIQSISGVRTVQATFTMNTHGNVLLGYPLTIGTGAAGTLTLTRGILMNSTANVLTINNTLSTGVVGTLASTATPPLTHGSYVTGAVRINFPVGTTTGRSFPLGRGASFNGAVPNENLLKTVAIAAGATAWNGQSLTVSLESGASGTPVAPLTALQTSYAYRLNLNGGNDLSTTATLQISGNNYQFGGALSSDNLIGQQNELFVAQSPSLTGGSWTSRSLTSGAGAFVNNTSYPRVTVATAPGPIGPLATNGEYFILASSTSACSGTPVPGLTTSTTPSACSGVNFTLGISNAQGTGVTYSWEFDNGGGWTAFGTNAPTQLVNQSVSTSYRCTVNCPAGGGSPTFATSTPLTIPMATTFPMDFEVVTPFPSNCWTQTGSATYFYRGTGFSGYGTGTGSAKWDYWNAPSGTVLTLTSPAFTPVPANRQVRFDVAGTQWNGDPLSIDHINLETSTTGPAGPWTLVSDMTNASGGLLQTVPATGAAYNPGAGEWATRIFPIATGTNAIRFRGVAGFGNNVYLDNILIEAVPNCLPPTSVTAVGTSGTTASVSWSGAGTYVVEYGPAATFTTPGTGNTAGAGGTVILGATSPTTIPGLTHPTQYRVFVRHDCTGTGDGYSTNSAGILFYPQPPNDLCPNAPPHTISPGGTISVTGNSYGATDTEGFGALNAWEKLTLTGCVTTLEINYCSTAPVWNLAFNNLFTSCPVVGFIPPTVNANSCPNGNRRFVYNNVPAGTYYIGITNMVNGQGPYDITVIAGPACPPPPANDLCVDAVPIACGQTLSGTTVNATTTGAPVSLCGGFLNNTSGGVWYKATGICGSVTASVCTSLPAWDSKIAVYSGSCGSLVCVNTDDDFCAPLSQITWTANATETYYIYVLGFSSTDAGAFNLSLNCVNTPVVASGSVVDNCGSNFFNVFVNITSGTPATINWVATPGGPGSMAGVPGSNAIPTNFPVGTQVAVTVSNGGSGCAKNLGSFYSNCPVDLVCGNTITVNHCYTNSDGRSFSYHAEPGQTVTITFITGDLAPGDVINTYSGTDNTGTPIPGLTLSGALTGASGTSLGQDIFMQIVADGSGSCLDGDPNASNWTFEVECTPACTDPTAIVDELSVCATYSFTLSVDVTDYGTGAGAIPETTADLQYTVNGGSPITIPNVPIGATTIPTVGSFTIGDVVNVVLLHGSDPACDHNFGNFNGDQGCPPPGYTCALPLDVTSYPYSNSNTTCGAGNDVIGTQCGLGANYGGGDDFIYRLLNMTAGQQYTISLTLNGGNSFAGWFLKTNTNCNNAAACVANAVTTVVNGTASAMVTIPATGTYYLIVDSRPLPTCVGYTLVIAPFGPPANDLCANATVLTVQNQGDCPAQGTTGDNTFASQDGPAPSCDSGGPWPDVWYRFNSGPNGSVNIDFTDLGMGDAVIDVFQGSCVGASVACGFFASFPSMTVVPNTNYYIRVSNNAQFGAGGPHSICVSQTAPPPANDLCANAIAVGCNSVTAGTTTGSTNTQAPGACGTYDGVQTAGNVWYTLPGWNGNITASLCGGTSYDSQIGIFTGTCGALTCVAGNDDFCGLQSSVTWAGVSGTTYYIMVTGFNTATGNFSLAVTSADADNDLVPDCMDNCPLASNAGQEDNDNDGPGDACDTDDDNDGVLDVNDNCPLLANAGQGNNDGDGLGDACDDDDDNDGVLDVDDNCPLFANAGQEDNDDDGLGDACDPDDDNDGILDGVDNCPLTDNVGQEDNDDDGQGDACDTDDDNDGISDLTDSCPFVFGENGDFCDANPGPGYTLGQITGCVCTPQACTTNLTLEFQSDGVSNTTWEIRQQGTNIIAQSGGGLLPPSQAYTENTCLPDGCYYLVVYDNQGDGITNGGYILRTAGSPGIRIIDDRRNFTTGFISQIANNEGFCLPLGLTTRPIFTSCDKLDWVTGEYFVCDPAAAVSALWNAGNTPAEAVTGYEFWIYNPNGGFSYRRFRSHAVSDGFSPDDASRACHMKINNWPVANQIPANVLMNVRVRTRINNFNGNWGAACRFMIDPVRAACPLTKLNDIPGSTVFSCNVTRVFGGNNYVYARPVTGANKYQFRFRIDAENFVTVRNSNNYICQLNWAVLPLQDGKTYQVEVRASKNNGATWCIDVPSPTLGPPFTPWGDVCDLTIDNTPMIGGGQNFAPEGASLHMYPNPNRGDQLYVQLEAVEEGVLTVSVDIYDLYGKRVSARTIPVQDGFINTVLDLDGDMASGMYMVNITAGEQRYTERLVIQR